MADVGSQKLDSGRVDPVRTLKVRDSLPQRKSDEPLDPARFEKTVLSVQRRFPIGKAEENGFRLVSPLTLQWRHTPPVTPAKAGSWKWPHIQSEADAD